MKKVLMLSLMIICFIVNAQTANVWTKHQGNFNKILVYKGVQRESFPKEFLLYDLDIAPLRQELFSIGVTSKHKTIISLPNVDGQIEEFEVFEASNFEPDLQAQFPEIRAYSGKGITDKYATLKLSISPQGIQTMTFRTDKPNEFIEAYSNDRTVYAVFKSQRGKQAWSCGTKDEKMIIDLDKKVSTVARSSAGQLKTLRLAQSCNGEYANYFGATSAADVALVLAAFNATLTRGNGVYEKDLALHLNLVASTTNVIFYDSATDPYTILSNWNTQLQNTLSSKLTGTGTTLAANNAAYDIGHMFGASGGGGNAGCIGCVCRNDTASTTDKNKGSGITSPGSNSGPLGDNFDIDYVVHEIGHQLGAVHTFSFDTENTGVNMEVGSGITIMGYAGITSYDVAAHSIDKYHAASIEQIQNNLATKTCPVTINISANNATPVANAGADYTIPISTPYALTGSATDANLGDVLTYSWEQFDDCGSSTAAASSASTTKTIGPNFLSWPPTVSPTRYFPKALNTLTTDQVGGVAGMLSEALNSNARTMNFRLTVRDNVPYSSVAPIVTGQTAYDDMVISVSVAGGPFVVTSQNTAGISYTGLTTQTVSWNVASTNAAPFNATNVKISLSTDNLTFPTVLLANTPNDGSEIITIPNGMNSSTCRVKVEAIGNVFFSVNTNLFTISPALGTTNFDLVDFSLHPNPTTGNFTIQFKSDTNNDTRISVNDIQGRLIYNKSFTQSGMFSENLHLDNAQAGIYLVTILNGDRKVVKRIVVE